MINITIHTDFIKLEAALKLSGAVSTGGEAKNVITDSLVKVNDTICLMRGKKLRTGDVIEYNGNKFIICNTL